MGRRESACRAPKRSHSSRRAPVVFMDEPAQNIAPLNVRAERGLRVQAGTVRAKLGPRGPVGVP